jgi:hypothetical protein
MKIPQDHLREMIVRLFEAISRRFNSLAKPSDGSAASGTLEFKSYLREGNAVAVNPCTDQVAWLGVTAQIFTSLKCLQELLRELHEN